MCFCNVHPFNFVTVLGLCCRMRVFSSWGHSSCDQVFQHCGLSCCGAQARGHSLGYCGARASLPRGPWDLPGPDWTCVPCIDRWIVNHRTSREAPLAAILTFEGNELVYLSPWMARGLSNWVYFGWYGFLPTPHFWAWAMGSYLCTFPKGMGVSVLGIYCLKQKKVTHHN